MNAAMSQKKWKQLRRQEAMLDGFRGADVS